MSAGGVALEGELAQRGTARPRMRSGMPSRPCTSATRASSQPRKERLAVLRSFQGQRKRDVSQGQRKRVTNRDKTSLGLVPRSPPRWSACARRSRRCSSVPSRGPYYTEAATAPRGQCMPELVVDDTSVIVVVSQRTPSGSAPEPSGPAPEPIPRGLMGSAERAFAVAARSGWNGGD